MVTSIRVNHPISRRYKSRFYDLEPGIDYNFLPEELVSELKKTDGLVALTGPAVVRNVVVYTDPQTSTSVITESKKPIGESKVVLASIEEKKAVEFSEFSFLNLSSLLG